MGTAVAARFTTGAAGGRVGNNGSRRFADGMAGGGGISVIGVITGSGDSVTDLVGRIALPILFVNSSISSNLDDFHGEGFTIDDFLRMDNKKMKGKIISFPEKRGNRKTHFFYGNSDIEERFNLNYAIRNFDTTKERHIKNENTNYGYFLTSNK
jgi:hypothetical protein